jgi:hypothetical protein
MALGRKEQLETVSREIAAKAEKERAAETVKIGRLRALRLAKEAADREAAPPPVALPRRGQTTVRVRRIGTR